ncbi:LOW QUALITY PROTEIN: nestin [Lontra canadensis]|uniref:LOW QUALITY PROTEIN: nestin n=1 Tax=Lontra canadensis TaxID=76717 RepID=UPI0013F2CA48|nr:LOW QUALITY PROTEIN: nestin [Lontra canadensis]
MEGCLGEESFQMWELNRRLEAYLARVKALEEQNELLGAELGGLRAQTGDASWRARADDELAALRALVDQRWREKHAAEVARDNLAEEVAGVAGQCQQQRLARERAAAEAARIRRAAEAEKCAQTRLSARAAELERELEVVCAAHEEERAVLSARPRAPSRPAAPRGSPAPAPELEELARQLGDAWRGAVRGYQERVARMETSLGQARERLGRAVQGAREGRLELQQLQAERGGLRERRAALEQRLESCWQERLRATEKFQSTVEALEQEKLGLQGQTAQVLAGRRQLAELQMSLSLEVATYRTLLEAENSRLQTPGGVSKASLCFQDPKLELHFPGTPEGRHLGPLLSALSPTSLSLPLPDTLETPVPGFLKSREFLQARTPTLASTPIPPPTSAPCAATDAEIGTQDAPLSLLQPQSGREQAPEAMRAPALPSSILPGPEEPGGEQQEAGTGRSSEDHTSLAPPLSPDPCSLEAKGGEPSESRRARRFQDKGEGRVWGLAEKETATEVKMVNSLQQETRPEDGGLNTKEVQDSQGPLEEETLKSVDEEIREPLMSLEKQSYETLTSLEENPESLRSLKEERLDTSKGLEKENRELLTSLEEKDAEVVRPLEKETRGLLKPVGKEDPQTLQSLEKENRELMGSLEGNVETFLYPEKENHVLVRSLEENFELMRESEKENQEPLRSLEDETLENLRLLEKENQEPLNSPEGEKHKTLRPPEKENQEPVRCLEKDDQGTLRPLEKENQESLRSLEEEDQESVRPLEEEYQEPVKSVGDENQETLGSLEKENQRSLGSLEEEDQKIVIPVEENQEPVRSLEDDQETLNPLEKENQEPVKPLEDKNQETLGSLEKETQRSLRSLEEDREMVRPLENEHQEPVVSLVEEDQATLRLLEKENHEPLKSLEDDNQETLGSLEKENQRSLGSLEEDDQETVSPLEKENQEPVECLEEEGQETLRPLEKENQDPVGCLVEDQATLRPLEKVKPEPQMSLGKDQEIFRSLENENQQLLQFLKEESGKAMRSSESENLEPPKSAGDDLGILKSLETQEPLWSPEEMNQETTKPLDKEIQEPLESVEDGRETQRPLEKEARESLGRVGEWNLENRGPPEELGQESQRSPTEEETPAQKGDPEPPRSLKEAGRQSPRSAHQQGWDDTLGGGERDQDSPPGRAAAGQEAEAKPVVRESGGFVGKEEPEGCGQLWLAAAGEARSAGEGHPGSLEPQEQRAPVEGASREGGTEGFQDPEGPPEQVRAPGVQPAQGVSEARELVLEGGHESPGGDQASPEVTLGLGTAAGESAAGSWQGPEREVGGLEDPGCPAREEGTAPPMGKEGLEGERRQGSEWSREDPEEAAALDPELSTLSRRSMDPLEPSRGWEEAELEAPWGAESGLPAETEGPSHTGSSRGAPQPGPLALEEAGEAELVLGPTEPRAPTPIPGDAPELQLLAEGSWEADSGLEGRAEALGGVEGEQEGLGSEGSAEDLQEGEENREDSEADELGETLPDSTPLGLYLQSQASPRGDLVGEPRPSPQGEARKEGWGPSVPASEGCGAQRGGEEEEDEDENEEENKEEEEECGQDSDLSEEFEDLETEASRLPGVRREAVEPLGRAPEPAAWAREGESDGFADEEESGEEGEEDEEEEDGGEPGAGRWGPGSSVGPLPALSGPQRGSFPGFETTDATVPWDDGMRDAAADVRRTALDTESQDSSEPSGSDGESGLVSLEREDQVPDPLGTLGGAGNSLGVHGQGPSLKEELERVSGGVVNGLKQSEGGGQGKLGGPEGDPGSPLEEEESEGGALKSPWAGPPLHLGVGQFLKFTPRDDVDSWSSGED